MKELNKNFGIAIKDLIWLLDRGYPKKGSIELVGNRYGLNREERLMLYRGVFDTRTCRARKGKKVSAEEIQEIDKLYIDCYNLMITLKSYLLGRTVFRGLDGYVRDTAGVYGNFCYDSVITKVLKIIAEALCSLFGSGKRKTNVLFYLDSPVSRSGELAYDISRIHPEDSIILEAVLSRNPDLEMLEKHNNFGGVLVSSDTVVIDRAMKVFDFAEWIIYHSFRGEIIDLAICRENVE